jgi:hypothetical protein
MLKDKRYQYHPVQRDDIHEFRMRINELIEDGYIPFGEPKVFESEDKFWYLQFMVHLSLWQTMNKYTNHG